MFNPDKPLKFREGVQWALIVVLSGCLLSAYLNQEPDEAPPTSQSQELAQMARGSEPEGQPTESHNVKHSRRQYLSGIPDPIPTEADALAILKREWIEDGYGPYYELLRLEELYSEPVVEYGRTKCKMYANVYVRVRQDVCTLRSNSWHISTIDWYNMHVRGRYGEDNYQILKAGGLVELSRSFTWRHTNRGWIYD